MLFDVTLSMSGMLRMLSEVWMAPGSVEAGNKVDFSLIHSQYSRKIKSLMTFTQHASCLDNLCVEPFYLIDVVKGPRYLLPDLVHHHENCHLFYLQLLHSFDIDILITAQISTTTRAALTALNQRLDPTIFNRESSLESTKPFST